jgi:hypothetical protein
MTDFQTAIEIAMNQVQIGKITTEQANVLAVQIAGVRIITNKIPAQVRKALNAAVKNGELGHLKAEGLRPEAYFHKNARTRALDERDRIFRNRVESLKGVFA